MCMLAKPGDPVVLVAPFGIGEFEQDFTFFTLPFLGQGTVHALFDALIGQVFFPATNVLCLSGHGITV